MKKIYITILVLFLASSLSFADGIDTAKYVSIGGIEQFVSIQGKDAKNPLLLYIHGGPGQAASKHRNEITNKLEDNFVVVHWDQRNSGHTLQRNADSVTVTSAVMKKDAEEMVKYLLTSLHKTKLTLVANSWGNILAFHLAHTLPNKIENIVSISPVVNILKSQQMAKDSLINYFSDAKNSNAVTELSG